MAVALAIIVVGYGRGSPRRPPAPVATARLAASMPRSPASPTTGPKPASATTTTVAPPPAVDRPLRLVDTITGDISPKSVDATGTGLVFAQNMMYRHTMSVYNDAGALVKTIPDSVDLASFGYPGHGGLSRGAPVEGAVSPDHRFFYVTNYSMYGTDFGPEGSDNCRGPAGLSPSFVYRVDLKTLAIDGVAQVGMVPKFITVTPDNRYILVTNWCSFDLSVIDRSTFRQVRRIYLGTDPRGIAVNKASTVAYVAVMGSTDIARLDLHTFAVSWFDGVGLSPRQVVLDPTGRYLYATLNGDSRVVKIDTATGGGGRARRDRRPTSQHDDLARRDRALCRQLSVEHRLGGAGVGHERRADHRGAVTSDRNHVRAVDPQGVGGVLQRRDPRL